MRKFFFPTTSIVVLFLLVSLSCHQKVVVPAKKAIPPQFEGSINQRSRITFDSTLVESFYTTYPDLLKYSKKER